MSDEEEEPETITDNWSVWMFLGLAMILLECAVGATKKWIRSRQKKSRIA